MDRSFLFRPRWARLVEADGLGRFWGVAELLAGSVSEGATRAEIEMAVPLDLSEFPRAAVILNAPTHACLTCCCRNTLC
eukprot:scaffold125675_cov63-Phaeocystis_antarctica.AAC.4